MSRTDKDRPYEVKLNDLRAEGKVRQVPLVVGNNLGQRTSPYSDKKLSKIFLKGDLEAVKAHRALLEGVDAKIVETEPKLRVVTLYCTSEEARHEHDDTLYQNPVWSDGAMKLDDLPVYSWGSTHPKCCFPRTRATRTCVQFMVYQNYQHEAHVELFDDYDREAIPFSSPSKSKVVSRVRRSKERQALGNLRRSRDISKEWDDNADIDADPRPFVW